MPKRQSIIQECVKCGFTFTSYYIQQKCNDCQTINAIVKSFADESANKPNHKPKDKIWIK